MREIHWLKACAWWLVLALPAWAEPVIFVDATATGANDGTSWPDAYIHLQDALQASVAGDQLWIAAGTYVPDRGTGDPFASFVLRDKVVLYGGFAGFEACLDERDWIANRTTLSGDLAGDDHLAEQPTSTCCMVTAQPGCDDQSCTDRITARSSQCDVGWYSNCQYFAQTLCCDLCRPRRCENSYNVLTFQGPGTVTLDGLVVEGGEAGARDLWFDRFAGGGLWAQDAAVILNHCEFRDNFAHDGAAVSLERSTAVITDCRFVSNHGQGDYTQAVYAQDSDLHVVDCEFTANRGGGLRVEDGSHLIERCLFADNLSTMSAGIGLEVAFPAEAEIRSCSFLGNVGGLGSGILNNHFARIDDCIFSGNLATSAGAAIENWGALIVTNSLFVGNHAGGFVLIPIGEPEPGFGGALSNAFGAIALEGCTFVGNSAGAVGGIYGGLSAIVKNCILWGNSNVGGSEAEGAQFYADGTASVDIDYSIIQRWSGGWGGVGNSGVDPLFVDPDGADGVIGTEDDDLRLSPDSPAIDAGDPNYGEGKDPLCLTDKAELCLSPDLDRHPRVLCGRVDIGAYEFGIGDYDCNRTVDLDDFAAWEDCVTGPRDVRGLAPAAPTGRTWSPTPQTPSPCAAFDFNADGAVDLRDFGGFAREPARLSP